MPRPFEHQFFVQHYFSQPYEGWGSVSDGLTSLNLAVEAMLANDHYDLSDPSLWLVERVDRFGKTYITDVTAEAWRLACNLMRERYVARGWLLPEWHPDYVAPEAPVRGIVDILSGDA
jgi:hypothetical protein